MMNNYRYEQEGTLRNDYTYEMLRLKRLQQALFLQAEKIRRIKRVGDIYGIKFEEH